MLNGRCDVLPWLPKKCREMLDSYGDDVDRHMAELVADSLLDYFTPKKNEYEKPDLLKYYESRTPLERASIDAKNPKWRDKDDVKKYYYQIDSNKLENQSNKYWLNKWAKLIETDELKYRKLIDKLKEYDSLPVDDPIVMSVQQQFSGRVVDRWDEEE